MRKLLLMVLGGSTVALAAHAQAPADPARAQAIRAMAAAMGLSAETCAATFQARLAEARAAITAHDAWDREDKRVMPWFNAHCRMLSPLEIAARQLDDPSAFVCETQKGRPKGLTSQFVLEHGAGRDISSFQEAANESLACSALGDPVSLSFMGEPPEDEAAARVKLAAVAHQLDVMCFRDHRKSCVKARADLAAAKAKLDSAAAAQTH